MSWDPDQEELAQPVKVHVSTSVAQEIGDLRVFPNTQLRAASNLSETLSQHPLFILTAGSPALALRRPLIWELPSDQADPFMVLQG